MPKKVYITRRSWASRRSKPVEISTSSRPLLVRRVRQPLLARRGLRPLMRGGPENLQHHVLSFIVFVVYISSPAAASGCFSIIAIAILSLSGPQDLEALKTPQITAPYLVLEVLDKIKKSFAIDFGHRLWLGFSHDGHLTKGTRVASMMVDGLNSRSFEEHQVINQVLQGVNDSHSEGVDRENYTLLGCVPLVVQAKVDIARSTDSGLDGAANWGREVDCYGVSPTDGITVVAPSLVRNGIDLGKFLGFPSKEHAMPNLDYAREWEGTRDSKCANAWDQIGGMIPQGNGPAIGSISGSGAISHMASGEEATMSNVFGLVVVGIPLASELSMVATGDLPDQQTQQGYCRVGQGLV
ncbi:hypothetical protein NE237_022239 [Protea cynaroides]|uniref:Uncharacterized protein n=1 Tax=Protea cynaroides TaxID=273540 RepID=A0A9Q0K533_9MAGN|nr:hypothetical protein NE237_022239 [Protea cynaroides]